MITNLNLSLKKWLDNSSIEIPEIYLVGGTVRDLFMGRVPKDLDLVCKDAGKFAAGLAAVKNAALVVLEKKPHQPCFRVVDREDAGSYLDITEMRGSGIHDDLAQRDFTINAIAIKIGKDGAAGEVIDPLKGAADIKKGTIRMVSDRCIISDPLRAVRAVRFAAVFGFAPDEAALNEMKLRAPMLRDVSAERVMTELMLILTTPKSGLFFGQMDELGMLEIIFPVIVPMKGCGQSGYHHKDVWGHSLLVMEQVEHIINNLHDYFGERAADVSENLASADRLPLLKLAALLHDLGKPDTRAANPRTGRTSFHNHDAKGAAMIEVVARTMKMSCSNIDFLVRLIAEHLNILTLASGRAKPAAEMRWFRKMHDDAVPAIILSMADIMSILGPDAGEDYRQSHMIWSKKSIIDYCENIRAIIERRPLVTGRDLIALGMEPGPGIGKVLGEVRDAQDTAEVTSREAALDLARSLKDRIS